jgi:hypothetical protein
MTVVLSGYFQQMSLKNRMNKKNDPQIDDEQYKKATKPLIDDAMRTDTLGPNLSRVLSDHKPVNDQLRILVAEAIKDSPHVKEALKEFMSDYDTKRKGIWADRVKWLIIGAIISGIIGLIIKIV